MATSVPNNVSSNDWHCTRTRGDYIEFEWTIEKFQQLPQKNGEDIWSPIFPNNITEQWKLRIYPQGFHKSDAGWISLFLWPISDRMLGIEIKCEITVFRLKKALNTVKFMYKFEKTEGQGYANLVERSKLLVNDDSTDAISIHCKIWVLGTETTSSSEKKSLDSAVTFEGWKNGLSRDFKSLYENPTFTDFTVISGHTRFPTHKVILASRSPVFAAMFQHKGMDENVKNEVKIENIEPAVVERVLEFIYTDAVSEIGDLARGLLAAAEQYGLTGLKKLCQRTLRESLNENNAAELLALADLHNAIYLKKSVMQYIVDHPEIAQSESFESVELSLQLSREIIRVLSLKAYKNHT